MPPHFNRGPEPSCGSHYLVTLSSPLTSLTRSCSSFTYEWAPKTLMRPPSLWQSIEQMHPEGRRACLSQFQRSQCLWPALRAGNRIVTSQGTRGNRRSQGRASKNSSKDKLLFLGPPLPCPAPPSQARLSPTASGVIWSDSQTP